MNKLEKFGQSVAEALIRVVWQHQVPPFNCTSETNSFMRICVDGEIVFRFVQPVELILFFNNSSLASFSKSGNLKAYL